MNVRLYESHQPRTMLINTYNIGTKLFWVVTTTAVVIGLPLVIQYERECQTMEVAAQLEVLK